MGFLDFFILSKVIGKNKSEHCDNFLLRYNKNQIIWISSQIKIVDFSKLIDIELVPFQKKICMCFSLVDSLDKVLRTSKRLLKDFFREVFDASGKYEINSLMV